MVLLFL